MKCRKEQRGGRTDWRVKTKMTDLLSVAKVRMIVNDVISNFAADGVVYLELRTTPRAEARTGMTKVSKYGSGNAVQWPVTMGSMPTVRHSPSPSPRGGRNGPMDR